LGTSSPKNLELLGNPDLLQSSSFHKLALFCSANAPLGVMVIVRELARAWREALGLVVISGFHSPAEAEAYQLLSRGKSPLVVCPPRTLAGMRLKTAWRGPLSQGRLLLLSFFSTDQEQVTRENAIYRNRCVAALADQIVIAYANPISGTAELVLEALGWGKQVYCLDIPNNHHLLEAGARSMPLPLSEEIRRGPSLKVPERSALETRLRKLAYQVNSSEPHRRIFHYALQTKIVDLANEFGLRAIAEYQIESVPPRGHRGRIDVVWLSGVKPVVAIEVDNIRREKSIYKLLESKSTHLFWIYRGVQDPRDFLASLDPYKRIILIWLPPPARERKLSQTSKTFRPTEPKTGHNERLVAIRNKYPNAYKPWTETEEVQLERRFRSGASYEELSQLLGRQPSAIRSRVKKLESEKE
jgi:hypothetical protein